ncbi:GNAT family N-acetyltransferase [Aureibacter tunicatorum]|uniref:GNAT superfamily N-acetyltransferase n=1 Tax=Aureibacter tunicatorum TaxID=866807 RepID=A0AAE3XRF0_9BACT|nr:GNAT family N-acetyltransferase [Aureibacter tunicatorum]MDR6240644.1 GNAT superfamily N-acetyltransferase [Aureibacter tunicatorum]BDD06495.1 N-acetyltransferase GCN5 [Aureibacter tunicatorum]
MEEIIIRKIRMNEVPDLISMCEAHADFEQATYINNDQEEILKECLFQLNPPLYCVVALREQSIMGYATYMKQFSTWDAEYYMYLDCLYLVEEARGLGYGRKIMEFIKSEALRLGCRQMQWQTPEFNDQAVRFYKGMGAVNKSKERFFWEFNAY